MNELIFKMLTAFKESVDRVNRGFLSSFFRTTEDDYTDTEEIQIDIQRGNTTVAPVVKNMLTGAVIIDADNFTSKRYTPPIMALRKVVGILDLMKRMPGESPVASAATGDWMGRLSRILRESFVKMFGMVKEGIELQASQILQTGKVTLQDEDGQDVYEIDFGAKATHFPTAAVAWSDAAADPMGDLASLAEVVTRDGLRDATHAIFGANAWKYLSQNKDFQDAVKKDGLNMGALNPEMKNKGGRYIGYVVTGSAWLHLWVYDSSYQKLGSNDAFSYMDADKVIITADFNSVDFRCVFGGVPSIGMDQPFNEIMPEEVYFEGVARINTRVYKDQVGDNYSGEIKCRPLCIPVSIDRFGCLTVA